MKASMTLKPLVIALAAGMAISAQAGQSSHSWGYNSDPLENPSAGNATATVTRSQYLGGGSGTSNQGTENSVDLTDSLSDNEGNVGANIAAGSMNQQVNDVAIATADEDFVFGSATASVDVAQSNYGSVAKFSGSNAMTGDGMGNGASGNVGINIAAGDMNQQSNAVAIATARGWSADAMVSGTQSLDGVSSVNEAAGVEYTTSIDVTKSASKSYEASGSASSSYEWGTASDSSYSHSKEVSASLSASAESSYTSDYDHSSSLNASLDTANSHSSSSSFDAGLNVAADASADADYSFGRGGFNLEAEAELNVDASGHLDTSHEAESSSSLDASLDKTSSTSVATTASIDKEFSADYSSSESAQSTANARGNFSGEFEKAYEEASESTLSASATFTKTRVFLDPVTNSVSLNNSFSDISGNLGVNVSSGTNNQQLNTMTIAAGCNACANND